MFFFCKKNADKQISVFVLFLYYSYWDNYWCLVLSRKVLLMDNFLRERKACIVDWKCQEQWFNYYSIWQMINIASVVWENTFSFWVSNFQCMIVVSINEFFYVTFALNKCFQILWSALPASMPWCLITEDLFFLREIMWL